MLNMMGTGPQAYGLPLWESEKGIRHHLFRDVIARVCAAVYTIERADGDRKELQESGVI